jgi:hypothetical protein
MSKIYSSYAKNHNSDINVNPFRSIIRNLSFEAEIPKNSGENTQQNSNVSNSGGGNLDDELNELREEKNESQNQDSPSESDEGNESENGGSAGDNLGSQDLPSDADSDPLQSSDDPSEQDGQKLSVIGGVNRKLTLYTEFNRIISVIKESVDALNRIDSERTEIKSCVAQLQKIYDDGKLFVTKFKDYSDADIMLQLEMLKERSSLIIERLQRLQQQEKPPNTFYKEK